MTENKITFIDLFCGAGGFSTGFQANYNFELLAGVDYEPSVKDTFLVNHRKKDPNAEFFQYDIREDLPEFFLKNEIDLVIGSPPCQGFSDARGTRYQLDEKNDLVVHYFKWVDQIRPKIAVMENVKGMTTIGSAWITTENPDKPAGIDFMEKLKGDAKDIGYKFGYKVLNSYYYGVPQARERVFAVFVRNDLKQFEPALPIPMDHDDINTGKNKGKKGTSELNINKYFLEQQEKTTLETALKYIPKEPIGYYSSENKNRENILEEKISIEKKETNTPYERFVFDSDELYDHVALGIPYEEEELQIIRKIPPGRTFRSDRLGDKNIGAWDLFEDVLSLEERELIRLIAILRTKEGVKTKEEKNEEGYVERSLLLKLKIHPTADEYYVTKILPIAFSNKSNHLKDITEYVSKIGINEEIINKLVNESWLQYAQYITLEGDYEEKLGDKELTKSHIKYIEKTQKLHDTKYVIRRNNKIYVPLYKTGMQFTTLSKLEKLGIVSTWDNPGLIDITSKAGLRGKYSRQSMEEMSRTLMTQFTSMKELIHPTETRGFTLREGARIMSFPDSFRFYGTFNQRSMQIGNAVAPLVSKGVADFVADYYFNENKLIAKKIQNIEKNKKPLSLNNFL